MQRSEFFFHLMCNKVILNSLKFINLKIEYKRGRFYENGNVLKIFVKKEDMSRKKRKCPRKRGRMVTLLAVHYCNNGILLRYSYLILRMLGNYANSLGNLQNFIELIHNLSFRFCCALSNYSKTSL